MLCGNVYPLLRHLCDEGLVVEGGAVHEHAVAEDPVDINRRERAHHDIQVHTLSQLAVEAAQGELGMFSIFQCRLPLLGAVVPHVLAQFGDFILEPFESRRKLSEQAAAGAVADHVLEAFHLLWGHAVFGFAAKGLDTISASKGLLQRGCVDPVFLGVLVQLLPVARREVQFDEFHAHEAREANDAGHGVDWEVATLGHEAEFDAHPAGQLALHIRYLLNGLVFQYFSQVVRDDSFADLHRGGALHVQKRCKERQVDGRRRHGVVILLRVARVLLEGPCEGRLPTDLVPPALVWVAEHLSDHAQEGERCRVSALVWVVAAAHRAEGPLDDNFVGLPARQPEHLPKAHFEEVVQCLARWWLRKPLLRETGGGVMTRVV